MLRTYAFVDLGYLLKEVGPLASRVLGESDALPILQPFMKHVCEASRMYVYYAAETEYSEDAPGVTKEKREAQKERLAQAIAVGTPVRCRKHEARRGSRSVHEPGVHALGGHIHRVS